MQYNICLLFIKYIGKILEKHKKLCMTDNFNDNLDLSHALFDYGTLQTSVP